MVKKINGERLAEISVCEIKRFTFDQCFAKGLPFDQRFAKKDGAFIKPSVAPGKVKPTLQKGKV